MNFHHCFCKLIRSLINNNKNNTNNQTKVHHHSSEVKVKLTPTNIVNCLIDCKFYVCIDNNYLIILI